MERFIVDVSKHRFVKVLLNLSNNLYLVVVRPRSITVVIVFDSEEQPRPLLLEELI